MRLTVLGILLTIGTQSLAAERFEVPNGFRVEQVVSANPKGEWDRKLPFSLVDLCTDDSGGIYAAQERGPILRIAKDEVRLFCSVVTNCQGMCWFRESFYMVGDGPQGTGVYRSTKIENERVVGVERIMAFEGGMAEHGPHAIVVGPDQKLYIVVGNHAWPKIEKLAADSPLRRWPTGQMGLDQGQPGTTEDVLLPRLNDARGHAADIRAPGGTIWRIDPDGKNPTLFAAGFRNSFDAAFNRDGECFTFDSDMEWDEGLPWYRPVRVCHCIPGADFMWRTGASNTPNHYIDSLPPLAETGRGSPVGIVFNHHTTLPGYDDVMFMADWSIGTIYAMRTKQKDASYTATVEKFCTGTPMNVTDLALGVDGSLYFTLGGRGTEGGIYRIVAKNPTPTKFVPLVRKSIDDPLKGLKSDDLWVRRKACEACIERGIIVPDVNDLKPLLNSDDRFLRTAARLVLQRIEPSKWATALIADSSDRIAFEAIVGLCKTHQAEPFASAIFERLTKRVPQELSEHPRVLQLALIHTQFNGESLKSLGIEYAKRMLTPDVAIVLTELARRDLIDGTIVISKLLQHLRSSARQEQIHDFYCLRLLHRGWTAEQKTELLIWFESTKTWSGGYSFAPFMENILRDLNPVFTTADRLQVLERAKIAPWTAAAMLRMMTPEQLPEPTKLLEIYRQLQSSTEGPRAAEMREGIVDAILRSRSTEVPNVLRTVGTIDPQQGIAVARGLVRYPSEENYPHFVHALELIPPPLYAIEMMTALSKLQTRPKPDDAKAFRIAIVYTNRMAPAQRWEVVKLLRYWSNGKDFGAEDNDWKSELTSWSRWYAQTFPKEPPLPNLIDPDAIASKYTFDELLKVVEPMQAEDVKRGKLVFTKAQCIKCHKYGTEGESIGPDLTTLSKRFKRRDTLEAIVYPSKVISDQYRSSTIELKSGVILTGLLASDNDRVSVFQADGSKLMVKASDIERKVTSLVSVMPERLLDTLTKEEIADLFAYLESNPSK